MSLSGPLQQGWRRMVVMLFRPFDPARWLVLGFAAWLAGLASGGSHSGIGWSRGPGRGDGVESARSAWDWLQSHGAVAVALLVVAAALCALLVLVLWVSSRGTFVFLDNVVRNEAAIVEPWRRLRSLGNSLFAFRLVVLLIGGTLALGLVGAFFWLGIGPGRLGRADWSVGIGLVVVAIAAAGVVLLIVLLYAAFFLDAFVVPLMHRFDLGVLAAWKRFLGLLAGRPGWFLGSGLFVLALYVLVFSAVMAAGLMTCCLGFLLLAMPYVGTVILLPLITAYRAFTVAFLAQLEPGLRFSDEAPAGSGAALPLPDSSV